MSTKLISFVTALICKREMRKGRGLFVLLLFVTSVSADALDPGIPFKLNHVLPINENVLVDFKLSPDGNTVYYRARTVALGEVDLYRVAVGGGEPINLTNDPDLMGNIQSFRISNDGLKVVFLMLQGQERSLWLSTDNVLAKLSNNQQFVTEYIVSPDSSKVVFRSNTETPFTAFRLFATPIQSPLAPPNRVGPELVVGGNVAQEFKFRANNSVVFRGDIETVGVQELFISSPRLDDFFALKVSRALTAGGDVNRGFDVSADGRYIVYTADARIDGVTELFSTRMSSPIVRYKLNPNNLSSTEDVLNFKISPNNARVVYMSDERSDNVNELFSVAIDDDGGTQASRISTNLSLGGDVQSYAISPNSARVAYTADQINGKDQLFSTPIVNRNTVSLTPSIGPNDDVLDFQFNRFGSRVVYNARQSDVRELFSVRVAGGDTKVLNPPLAMGGDVINQFYIDPKLDRVFYLADQSHNEVYEVFSTKIEGPLSSNTKLNKPFGSGSFSDISNYLVSPNGKYLVYRADQDTDHRFELYSVELDSSGMCFPIKTSSGNVAVVCL